MTHRLSQNINPRWLLHAGSAQATCADQLSAQFQTTYPLSSARTAWRTACEARVCSTGQHAKQPTEIEAATAVSARSP